MNREPKRYLVTSALPYANGPLHIGHLAGAYLSADIYCSYQRLMGKDVVYICGSDEHGAAITMRAKKEGISPQEIIDKYHNLFKDTFKKIGVRFDHYHRTSAPLHHETSQEFFRTLYKKGEFVEQESEQYYDPEAGQFLADRYIKGTCPKCSHPSAYGDQCENCGSSLSPTELIDPVSTLTGGKPVLKTTTHWYLPLDKYEDWLSEWINTGKVDGIQLHDPSDWKNHVVGQCKSWIEGGLQARSMTRDLDWGVDVPHDVPGHEGKKLYVWLDAPIGYISSTKQWAKENGEDWEPYWKDEESALIHFIGKDNIVFHCIIFPGILRAHGEYILPVNVPANQFMNLENEKISTSRNWAVWVHEYVEDFPGQEDVLRYYLTKNMPEQRDSEFTWKGFQEANNNELVNNLANFFNRVIVLTNKYYNGAVPRMDDDQLFGSVKEGEEVTAGVELERIKAKLEDIGSFIKKFEFRAALGALMELSSSGNQLLQFNEPWKLVKTNPEKVVPVMRVALDYAAALSVAVQPFLPFTSKKMRGILNLDTIQEDGEWFKVESTIAIGEHLIPAGHQIGKPEHIFTRIDDARIEEQIDKLKGTEEESTQYAPVKDEIQYDDFIKLDLRTAVIRTAEKIEGAKKLLKIGLDVGFEQRTVVSGIAEYYKPEDIIGLQVTYVANLAPKKLRGVMSEGMILMAEDSEGKLSFVHTDEGWPVGSVVR